MLRERCPNDNHGRSVVTVRCCPHCGEIVNRRIQAKDCPPDSHARMRRAQSLYCVDCGEGLARRSGAR